MRSRIALVAAALVVLLGVPPAVAGGFSNRLSDPRAHAGEVSGATDTDPRVGTRGWRAGTFVVGDSVTRIALLDGLRPLHLGAGWEVSSVSGRDVSTMPYYLRDRVDAQQRLTKHSKRWYRRHPRARRYRYPLRKAVIALGSNATPGWSYADLRAAVNLVPRSVVVVLVTPYRAPAQWPDSKQYRFRASVVAAYASWEKRIAQLRRHTCVADWGAYVKRWPSSVHDGVHPTTPGAKAWARLVSGVVAHCR